MNIKSILEKNYFCEGQNLEVKLDFSKSVKSKFIRSVISFLNAGGGHYIIGISDEFQIIGIDKFKIDEYMMWMTNSLSSNIFNYTHEEISIYTEEYNEMHLIIVEIKAGSHSIYFDNSLGIYSGSYLRVGSTTTLIDRMRIDSIQQKFVQPDLAQIKAYHQLYQINKLKYELEYYGISTSDIALHNMGLLMENGDKTKLYELFADENITCINFSSFAGNDRVDLVERHNFGEQPIFQTAKKLVEKVELYNKTMSTITEIERIDIKLVDPIAIKELVINAIVHNDYSIGYPNVYWYKDKVEITSNGGLPVGMTFDEFYSGQSRPRNPKLAFIFAKLGLVEQIGSGMERILKAYDKSIFEITDSYFKVTLSFNKRLNLTKTNGKSDLKLSEKLSKYDKFNSPTKQSRNMIVLLDYIDNNNGVTVENIIKELSISKSSAYDYLSKLIDDDIIYKQRSNKVTLYYMR